MKGIEKFYVIKNVLENYFLKKGLIVSFIPKYNDGVGSGAHAHISLWKDGYNISGDLYTPYKISGAFESFMAGLLNHHNALV